MPASQSVSNVDHIRCCLSSEPSYPRVRHLAVEKRETHLVSRVDGDATEAQGEDGLL
jgi:hypothetical protein